MIASTEAVILTSMRYGDTSKIVTAYTRQFGKLSVIAKGAAGAKSKFGAALEPLCHCQLVLYKKESRDLHFLSQADSICSFRGIQEHPDKLMPGFAMVEFVHATVHGEEEHEELFRLLLDGLSRLEHIPRNPVSALLRFLLDFSTAMGFSIDLEHCLHCRADLRAEESVQGRVTFSAPEGGFTCSACALAVSGTSVSAVAFKGLQWLSTAGGDALGLLGMPAHGAHESVRILHQYIASHIQGMRKIHSLDLLDQLS
ncbi:MAG: DNA repair protein RecO [Ignavibacteria bacterium]|nr:DNA repair protein RecO [Ignavibacteria bacterium]